MTKISHGPPSTIVCKLMNLTEAFLTENHQEVRIREGRKDRKLEILRYYQEIYEKQSFRGELEGRGVVEGVGNFQCRPINPVILFYLINWSMTHQVSSCTNRAGLKQPDTTVWIKPQASQAHVSRKRKQLTNEGVTRCVTWNMGNRNNSDGKTSLKRQRTPETTTDTQDVSKF